MKKIYYNGNIVTLDAAYPAASAVCVNGGVFARVGGEELLSLADKDTELVDLGGRLVLPGFNDSHMHLLDYILSKRSCDLSGAKSVDDLVTAGRRFLSANGDMKWLHGCGFNEYHFDEKRMPTRYDLDRVSTELPVTYARVCEHAVVCNSYALKLAGIDGTTKQPDGGSIEMVDGEPNGILCENAIGMVLSHMPLVTKDEVKALIRAACRDAAACGLTSVQTDDLVSVSTADFYDVIDAYAELDRAGELPLRVYEQCQIPDTDALRDFFTRGYTTGWGSEVFKIGPLKLIGDGSLGARTAYMKKPYADEPGTRGIPCFNSDELYALVKTAHNGGMQCAIHCIGDAAMNMALDAYERVMDEFPRADMRHGIVHCQITDAQTLERFRRHNVVAYIQPIFLDYDMHIAEERVGSELAGTSYAWRTLRETGVHTACGSDCPVESFNPLRGIYCAVTRQDMEGFPDGGWNPCEKLSVMDAVRGFTIDGAYASHEESIKGSITVGKLADFVVLDRDIFTIPNSEIKDVNVTMTVLGGKTTFERD